jgi:hypothetical protein|tara:strand:+ start:3505 stop:3810 length:306 start_codon:yes stop_codon:yes gene_type:complete
MSGKIMNYKFKEDEIIKDIIEYVNKTYAQHYSGGKYQATDMILDAGHGESFCIGNIMKYAMRYGKKNGKSEMDLLKIIHYAIIALYVQRKNTGKESTNDGR